MYRKFLQKINYHHLIPLFSLLSLIFVTAGGVIYLQVPVGDRGRGFYLLIILLVAVLLWAMLLIISTNVARRDGFLEGYGKGLEKSFKNWAKK